MATREAHAVVHAERWRPPPPNAVGMPAPTTERGGGLGASPPPPVRSVPVGFQKGNRYASSEYQRSLNPVQDLRRKARYIHASVKGGKLDANRGNTMLACLKFELELIDRVDIGEQFVRYEREIQKLERRMAALVQHRSASSP